MAKKEKATPLHAPRTVERPKVEEVFEPSSYEELVDWFVQETESGVATRKDFVRLAKNLKLKLNAKKSSSKKKSE